MSEPLHCVNHPNVETMLRCNRCGQPICARCAVLTPVGYRCKQCVRAQQRVFYAASRLGDNLIAGVIALPLGLLAGWLIPSLGWFTLFLAPLAGGGIAEVVRWATGRRRGPYLWLVVCVCIILGYLPMLLRRLLPLLLVATSGDPVTGGVWIGSGLLTLLWDVLYVVLAVGAAYARLRVG